MSFSVWISSLSFAIYYTVNFIFFDEKAIHKIYEAQGKYDFIYFIPRISISFIVSHFIYIIIKYIFLSERNLLQIRKQNYCFNSSCNIIKRKKKLSNQIYYVFYIRINISWIFLDTIIIIWSCVSKFSTNSFWKYISMFSNVFDLSIHY